MARKKICVLATGGTIASRPTANGLAPGLSGEDILKLVPEVGALAEVECVELMQLDSSNLVPQHWRAIARAVAERREAYDGFVITHGTDTMAYTSAALYYMLEKLDRPVVLTGSQLPVEASASDAPYNLLTALKVALSGRAGVFLAFGGRIIRGNAARKVHSLDFKAFDSLNAPLEGELPGGAQNIKWLTPEIKPSGAFRLNDKLNSKVAVLKLTPGMSPEVLHYLADTYDGIIIEGYGLGGVPNQESALNFLPELERALKKCRVICTTQCTYGGSDLSCYEMGVRAQKLGAVNGGELPLEALVPKLMLELAADAQKD